MTDIESVKSVMDFLSSDEAAEALWVALGVEDTSTLTDYEINECGEMVFTFGDHVVKIGVL